MLTCTKCGTNFVPSPKQEARRDYRCNVCSNEAQKLRGFKRRLTKPTLPRPPKINPSMSEAARAYARQAYFKKKSDPEQHFKMIVRSKLRRAVATGRMTRLPCIICGAAKSEGHHHDYSKPYDVQWLCRRHHVEIHKGQ